MTTGYTWDESSSSWVGTNKYEKENVELQFGHRGSDPMSQYDDEYLPHEASSQYEQTYMLESKRFFQWDKAKNDWVQYNKENEETKEMSYQMDNDKLTYTVSTTNNDRTSTIVSEILLNNDHYITSESSIEQYKRLDDNVTGENKDITTYSYNKYGKLEEINEENYADGQLSSSRYEKFIFEEARILPTLIDKLPLSNGIKDLHIDGLKITCESNSTILLYDEEGRLTVKGIHCVMAPKSGIYIIKMDGKALKIYIKS